MKKGIILGFLLLLLAGADVTSAAPGTTRVLVNGHEVTGDTVDQSGTTLVPFKVIFEELDYQIAYTAATKTIKADKAGVSVSLTVGSRKAYVNGKETQMPVAPKSRDGVTYVPLRFVAEVSREEVAYNKERNAIQIGKSVDWALLDKPSFRKAKWGMTREQVKKSENSVLLEDRKEDAVPYLHYQSKFAGFKGSAFYLFPNGTLAEAGYFLENSGVNRYAQDYKALVELLTEQYGEPKLEMLRLYKDKLGIEYTDEEWNQLMLSDPGEGLTAIWRSVDADIMLVVHPDLHDISDIQISYINWRSGNKLPIKRWESSFNSAP